MSTRSVIERDREQRVVLYDHNGTPLTERREPVGFVDTNAAEHRAKNGGGG